MIEPCDREEVAAFIDRYRARAMAGPAPGPLVNRHRLDAAEIATLDRHLRAIAQAVRAGVAEAEPYWPEAGA